MLKNIVCPLHFTKNIVSLFSLHKITNNYFPLYHFHRCFANKNSIDASFLSYCFYIVSQKYAINVFAK